MKVSGPQKQEASATTLSECSAATAMNPIESILAGYLLVTDGKG